MSDVTARKYRRGTNTRVSFPNLPSLEVQPSRIDLYQKQYSHDVMVLEYYSVSSLWFETIKTGAPITFTWNQDTLKKEWIGYVTAISKVDAPQRMNSMKLLCVGGSFPLKERVTRVFENTTIPEVVEKIASEYGFAFIGEPHEQRFSQLTISGSSYWEWIQEQAQKIGYGVLVDGMNFIFLPIDKLIDFGFSSAPFLSMGDSLAPFNTQFLDRTLDELKVINGDNIEDTTNYRAVKNVGGVDPVTNQVYLSSDSPKDTGINVRETNGQVLFSEYRTDRVINDAKAAEAAAKGAAQMARFSIPATAKAQGDPRVRPFGTVFISGTGTLTDGFWIVKEARHMFHKIGDYHLELKLATDGVGVTVETPFRSRPNNEVGAVNLESALKNKGVPATYFDMGSVVLVTRDYVVQEAGQGFTSVWKAN